MAAIYLPANWNLNTWTLGDDCGSPPVKWGGWSKRDYPIRRPLPGTPGPFAPEFPFDLAKIGEPEKPKRTRKARPKQPVETPETAPVPTDGKRKIRFPKDEQ